MAEWSRLALAIGVFLLPSLARAGDLLQQVRSREGSSVPEIGSTRERAPAPDESAPPPAAAAPAPSAPQWDPELHRLVYSIAQEAVENRLLDRETRRLFTKLVLPALANGCVGVVRTLPGQLIASDAVYDTALDAVKTPAFDPGDLQQRSVIIHELDHVVKDANRVSQKREDSENGAYRVQEEYKLRSLGWLRERDDGLVAIKIERDVSLLDSDIASAVVYDRALENLERGRANLNDFWVGATNFKGQGHPEVRQVLEQMSRNADRADRSAWRTATELGGRSGSGVGPDTLLKRNGFARCP